MQIRTAAMSDVDALYRSLQNECHRHSATLWRRTNRLPFWWHSWYYYNRLKVSVQERIVTTLHPLFFVIR